MGRGDARVGTSGDVMMPGDGLGAEMGGYGTSGEGIKGGEEMGWSERIGTVRRG